MYMNKETNQPTFAHKNMHDKHYIQNFAQNFIITRLHKNMKYHHILSHILMYFGIVLATKNKDLEILGESRLLNGASMNQQCIIGTTIDLQGCYSYLTNEYMPFPPNSCCFALNDLSSIDATGKTFTICQCLRALVSEPDVITNRSTLMAEGCNVSFSFDIFRGMSCS